MVFNVFSTPQEEGFKVKEEPEDEMLTPDLFC